MEYYSAIKKNTFESVLMRWMKLKPIIQSRSEERRVGKECRKERVKNKCQRGRWR